MTSIRLFLSTFALAVLAGACQPLPPPGTCGAAGPCQCAGGPECDLACPAVGCVAECVDVSNCDAACGDACSVSCRETSNCDLECADGCDAACVNCDVECGADCAVECTNLSNCQVTMVSGEVLCQGVSTCDVRCRLADDSTAPAEDCGGGVFRCPAGAC